MSEAKPFAHPYYQRRRHFLATRAAVSEATFPAGTFKPGQVPQAYQFPSGLGTPKVSTNYGIGSLGGNIPKSDVAKFCSDNNYPLPNLSMSSINGADTTTDPGGANVENNLDWQQIMSAWHHAYPTVPCNITVIIGPNSDNGIADVTAALVKNGCNVVTWSWGQAKSQWSASSLSYTESAFAKAVAAGVVIFAASGDNSIDDGTPMESPDYPSASTYVHGVGGTKLTIKPDGSYAGESAWGDGKPGDEGGGGGIAVGVTIPTWQTGVVPSTYRGVPDSSANADPNTGYLVWSDGTVGVVGGTSASAPLTCGLAGVLVSMGISLKNFEPILYANRKTCFSDVVIGSNGDVAGVGYDYATGLGSPIGSGWVKAFSGTVVPPPPPVNPPTTGATITLSGPIVPGGTGTYSIK